MIVAYILAKYPNLTETFIQNEITALRQRGLIIQILAIDKEDVPSVEAADTLGTIIYYGKNFAFDKFLAHLHCIAFYGYKYFRTLIASLFINDKSFCDPLHNLKAFSISVYFLYRLRRSPVRLVHAHFINMPATIASLLSRLSGLPYSCSAHAHDIYTGNVSDINRKIAGSVFTVTCTAANKDYLLKLCADNYHDKIIHIYHGIDTSVWPSRIYNPNIIKPVKILSIGRLVEKKGFNYLLEVVSILKENGLDVRCTIVGDGPLKKKLKNQAKELFIEDVVTFHGAQPHEHIKDLYAGCDFFVLPCHISKDGDRDGLPNVLLEAIALGIPVISSNISAIPELVKHRFTGMLNAAGDSKSIADNIMELTSNPELRRSLSVNGRSMIEESFAMNNCTSRLKELLDKAASGGKEN
ncbi:glycosyltransferase family 4 protein [Mucilaginibacter sp. SJ]|uniref:glycosyltransferase family 4 protein n=1 Tax=Mucilaginibacter sp. SJ TaxID=3029053 RepID=UPI0023A9A09B|nr:glycosyltransferase family 4 protein [Mucilaginibacter sp. SJ]WEA01627.1 glycosyltransferase family 4 protein [Mucilaginibacter sp. SJ]